PDLVICNDIGQPLRDQANPQTLCRTAPQGNRRSSLVTFTTIVRRESRSFVRLCRLPGMQCTPARCAPALRALSPRPALRSERGVRSSNGAFLPPSLAKGDRGGWSLFQEQSQPGELNPSCGSTSACARASACRYSRAR